MCSNLTEKQYYFENKKYTKEEYNNIINKYPLGKYNNIKKLKNQFKEIIENALHKATNNLNSNNVYGNLVHNSKDCMICFD
jgi:hypothetical protein